jgi:CheY-like chemotaxis protein
MFEYLILAHSDSETRSIFYEIFTNLGYKVTTVITYREVLDSLRKERPDYVIVDPAISDMPTDTLLEKIKATDADIKVVILERDKNRLQFTQDILKLLKSQQSPLEPKKQPTGIQFKANILVVDDEKECAELIKAHLSKKGYTVDTALTGEEAILKVETAKPDIVFLDVYLPGMDGIVVLKNIKNIDKSIIVIMATALADDTVIQEALKLGADGYLIKPFNLLKLEETIFNSVIVKRIR